MRLPFKHLQVLAKTPIPDGRQAQAFCLAGPHYFSGLDDFLLAVSVEIGRASY